MLMFGRALRDVEDVERFDRQANAVAAEPEHLLQRAGSV
jgi:hypothetical protein